MKKKTIKTILFIVGYVAFFVVITVALWYFNAKSRERTHAEFEAAVNSVLSGEHTVDELTSIVHDMTLSDLK